MSASQVVLFAVELFRSPVIGLLVLFAMESRYSLPWNRGTLWCGISTLAERDLQISALVEGSSKKDEKINYLESQLAMYRRMQFGQKRERFESDPSQMSLPLDAEPAAAEQQGEEIKEKIEYVRRRPNHKGRAKLPEHLPVEEIEIHPGG